MEDRSAKYRKLSALEHVTTRPGMYIGSVEPATAQRWVCDVGEDLLAVRLVTVECVPALLKLFDEVATNALDASTRDDTLKNIYFTLGERTLTVRNDGAGITVEVRGPPDARAARLRSALTPLPQVHAASGLSVPQLVFGELHAGENFESSEESRTVAGQNGLGVKLANIFSRRIEVRIRDAQTGSTWEGVWSEGMTKMATPKVMVRDKPAKGYVEVSFQPIPEFLLPGEDAMGADVQALLAKRALEIALAARPGVRVHINGIKLPDVTLKRFVQLFVGPDAFLAVDDQPGWRVALAAPPPPGGPLLQGLVNGVSATGAHVDHALGRVHAALVAAIAGKRDFKDYELKPAQLRACFAVFVIASGVNKPAFNSQSKDCCVSYDRAGTPGYTPSEAFIKKLAGSEALAALAAGERAKADKRAASKTDGRKTATVNVPKLIDAGWAGGARSGQCTLILTEGDSAKAFAVAGLAVLGHDKWGVFPLKGKLLNCREANAKQLSENAEIKNIKAILGLRAGSEHAGGDGLRYGSVLALTDADVDGAHIKGLLLNFLHAGWPGLATSGFLRTLATPLIRATRAKEVRDFFTTAAFDAWSAGGPTGYRVKYFKGLGTWGSAEARDLFRAAKPVRFLGAPDAEDRILLGFAKKRADDRKAWIQACTAQPPPPLDYSADFTITDFVDRDLVHYAAYSLHRAIPSVCDGLKPSQRKILFTTFERGYTTPAREIKVAQLAGAVAEKTLYLHGEASICEAIVCMAQSFSGANNEPLLQGNGQFGTRLENGKDAASPRYIFCHAAPRARLLFPAADDAVLEYATEEGQRVEPAAYWPVLPMLLINGTAGIATGYSTDVPPHSLGDVAANVRRFLAGQPFQEMLPHYEGFKGTITKASTESGYLVSGVCELRGDAHVVTELPPNGKSFTAYAEWAADAEKSKLRLLENKCTDTSCHFKVGAAAGGAAAEPALRLTAHLTTSNMHAFDTTGAIRRYESVVAILEEWCAWRLERYAARKAHLERTLTARADELASRARFVRVVISKKLVLGDHDEAALLELLAKKGFLAPDKLLGMAARSFTVDRALAIEREAEEAREAARRAKEATPQQMWEEDLARIV